MKLPARCFAAALLAAALLAACGSDSIVQDLDTRAVVIGIDGADWRIIEMLAEDGGMPNLMALRQRGVWGPIRTLSSIPLSPVIWTSVATGKSAKKHGITWFMVDRPDGTRVPVRSHNRQVKAIWNLLAEHDRQASVVGWWATYPAEDVGRGTIVSDALGYHGFGATARRDDDYRKTHPPELFADASTRVPAVGQIPFDFARRFLRLTADEYSAERFVAAAGGAERMDPQNPIHLFQQYAATAEGYTAITEDLLERRDDDLTMVYFEQVDSFSHLFMKYAPPKLEWIDEPGFERYRDIVYEWYRYQDELLGQLLERIDLEETAVFILSDHGFKSGERRITSTETVDVRRAHLDHETDGIFLAAGPDIRRGGAEIPGATVLDLTPTVLHYLGFPVAEDMDGKVLERVFSNDFRKRHQVRTIATYETTGEPVAAGTPDDKVAAADAELDAEDLAATEEALRALGYLGGSEDGGGAAGTEAAAAARVAAATGESSPEIHNNLGRIHLGDGEIEEARAQFEKALELDPRNAEALLNLGAIHRVKGRLGLAEHLVKRALSVDPSSIGALGELAELKREQGDLDESIRLYGEALSIDDSRPNLHLGLGDSLQRAGRFEEAEAAFRTVLGLDPDSYEAHYNLGVTFMNTQRMDDAVTAFEKALALDGRSPRSALAYNNLGTLHLRRGERQPAIEMYQRAAQAAPGHLESRYNLGVLLLQGGKASEAIPRLERAAAIDPNHQQVHATLGMAYLAAGRNPDAFRSFLLVRRLYPDNWVAALGLSVMAAATEQEDKARELLAIALEHGGEAARAQAASFPVLEGMLAEFPGLNPALDDLLPPSGRRGRRFVAWLLALVAAALALHGGFNLLVDPYDIYGSPLTLERTLTVRGLKLDLLRRFEPPPEALILGSSRVRMFDPAIASRLFGVRFFHAGGPVGGTADWLSFARYAAVELDYPIRLLILGVDAPSFSSQPNLWLHPVGHPELRDHLRHPLLTRIRSLTHVWSPDQTEVSWKRITAKSDELVRQAKQGFAAGWRRDGFRPVNPPLDREQIFQGNVELHRSHHPVEASHLANFETLVELAEERQIILITFVTPEAPKLRQNLEQTFYPAAREKTEELLRSAAAGGQGVLFCDLEVLRLETGDFVDPHHLSYLGGVRVLRLLELCARGQGWEEDA